MDVKTALSDLEAQGYFVWDDFLSSAEVDRISLDWSNIYERGDFGLAGTGSSLGAGPSGVNEFRNDETYWLDSRSLTTTQSIFWERLEEFKKPINETLFLGLWSFDGHYSRYPVAGQYKKHLDRFNNDDLRTISMVLYLNPTWAASNGGALRLHFASGILPKTLDLLPLGGRLVCFLSSELVHEVLAADKVRLSFSGWWKRRA